MARALHYVFKIGNRKKSYDFFTEVLHMKVLRHEEFSEGCKAACNGPYDGMWSKTMVGYGAEDDHFVFELTYNYGKTSYALGNDFAGAYIESYDVFANIRSLQLGQSSGDQKWFRIEDPDGHPFFISEGHRNGDPVCKIALNTNSLAETIHYWTDFAGMSVVSRDDRSCILSFGDDQCCLEWRKIDDKLYRGEAYGRIAFSIPTAQLKPLEEKARKEQKKILTPYTSLPTESKATVDVVILADNNDHEICFVGDEGFRELSAVDPKSDQLLRNAIDEDHSSEWDGIRRKKKTQK
ncbi:hypothetical protein AB6A40_000975 [Gnathostoma spinigerum]|uniref:VOC domain-containing protein n=1 Tax=Gnathostoma spinigerum TaxID=75299 RepID=A0ABD6E5B8_9BILA